MKIIIERTSARTEIRYRPEGAARYETFVVRNCDGDVREWPTAASNLEERMAKAIWAAVDQRETTLQNIRLICHNETHEDRIGELELMLKACTD